MDFKSNFQALLLRKPRYNLKQVQAEHCGYADTAVKSKRSYYSFGTFYCEDVLYGRYSRKCTDCCGITLCSDCELCIECSDCVACYDCTHCQNCGNSTSCWFSLDCYGCENCFGCVGLYQKKYHIFNEPHSQADYESYLEALDLKDPETQKTIREKLEQVHRTAPRLAIHHVRCEDCVGENLANCKSCYGCFDTFNSEDCLYNIETNGNKDCTDLTVCFECEACYQCIQSPLNYNSNFLLHTDSSVDCEFCAYSKNLKNCFGCVFLQNKEFHILNEPYEPEAYYQRVTEIKAQLIADHRYDLSLYFVSDYETQRLQSESDPAIQSIIPSLDTSP